MNNYLLVEKEIISTITFPNDDVIKDEREKKERSLKIYRATSLGNIENQKVYIIFQDSDSIKRVFTTIWAHTQEKIVLKKGVMIPVNRIVDIRFN